MQDLMRILLVSSWLVPAASLVLVACDKSESDGGESVANDPPGRQAAADLAAGSSSAPCTFDETLVQDNLRARVWIPEGESCSIGSYRIELRRADGPEEIVGGNRDGSIEQVWLSDLLDEGNPQIVVWMISAGSGSYGTLHMYREFEGSYAAMTIAELTPDQAAGYRGHDRFRVGGDGLERSFPLYRKTDSNAAPTAGVARFRYSFEASQWVRVEGE